MNFALTNARIITEGGPVSPGTVVVEGSKITKVSFGEAVSLKPGRRVVDLEGAYLGPGLVDLHLHGALGNDFMEADPAGIEAILDYHLRRGSATLLATTVCASPERLRESLGRLSRFMENHPFSALAGLHLEGPYINPKKSGALNPQAARPFDLRELDKLLEYPVKTVTIAPELVDCAALPANISFSIGHTEADYETARRAIGQGIRHTTHFFNAMPLLHHRRPGAALALLQGESVSLELIADCIHIHPEMLKFLYNIKGADRIILVSDATAPAGLPPGKYNLWGREATLTTDAVRYGDGTLAGSGLTLLEMMRRMIKATGCKLSEAFTMAAYNPARRIGLDDRKGKIAQGMDADLVVLDEKLNLLSVMVGGKFLDEV